MPKTEHISSPYNISLYTAQASGPTVTILLLFRSCHVFWVTISHLLIYSFLQSHHPMSDCYHSMETWSHIIYPRISSFFWQNRPTCVWFWLEYKVRETLWVFDPKWEMVFCSFIMLYLLRLYRLLKMKFKYQLCCKAASTPLVQMSHGFLHIGFLS